MYAGACLEDLAGQWFDQEVESPDHTICHWTFEDLVVGIECLCTLVVLMDAILVITSAPSFHGSSHDLWLVFSFVSPCLLCLYSRNFCAQSLFSSVSDTGH